MSWIETVAPGEADEELRRLYDRVRDPRSGELDNIMRVHSLHPQGLEAHYELYASAMTPTRSLRRADREMIALVVSRINDCHY
jgi:alkylhydroperoxidase family enzyme